MIRKIITYPNKRLFVESQPVQEFDAQLHKLLDDMYETMTSGLGIGLAAIQVDVPLRIFIANLLDENEEQKKEDLIEFINPKLIFPDGEKIIFQEGCLSVPGYFDEIERFKRVRVEFQNRFGEKQILDAQDILAVVIQHENEHLDGHLFIEKLNFTQKKAFEKDFKQRQKGLKKGLTINSSKKSNKNSKKKLSERMRAIENSSVNLSENSSTCHVERSETSLLKGAKNSSNSSKNSLNSSDTKNSNSKPNSSLDSSLSTKAQNDKNLPNSNKNSSNSKPNSSDTKNSKPNLNKNSSKNSAKKSKNSPKRAAK